MATVEQIFEEELLEEEYIAEGLRIFKASKQLNKLADKLEKKIEKKKETGEATETQVNKINTVVKKAREAASDFEKLEEKFKNAKRTEKKEIREEHKKLKEKYSSFLEKIRSSSFKKLTAALGIAGIIAAIATGQFWISLVASSPRIAASMAGGSEEEIIKQAGVEEV